MNLKNQKHIPVLLDAVLQYLAPQAGERYLDLTAGYGGHATAVLKKTANQAGAVLVDRDEYAVDTVRQLFPQTTVLHLDFLAASQQLSEQRQAFDMILVDLGVSSPHLDTANRGFALSLEGPLDMRMDQRQELTANDIVNHYDEAELADVIFRYGEDRLARRIAAAIVHHRPIKTTTELAAIIAVAKPGRSKIHPATQTFQALRIAVNDELRLVEQSLPLWLGLLNPGGRLVVISFHSLEDRLVKQALAEVGAETYDAEFRLLTKHPVTASEAEIAFNPRARSAKLRAAVKINKERDAK